MTVIAKVRPDLIGLTKSRIKNGMSVEQAAQHLSQDAGVLVGREVLRRWLKKDAENESTVA
jgi:hypothetical protein